MTKKNIVTTHLEPYQWKKGHSGNPSGSTKFTRDVRGIKLMNQREASKLIQRIMDMTPFQIQEMVSCPDTPSWELMIARVIDKALQDGDTKRLNFLFDRTIGKVLDKTEITITPVKYVTTVREDGALIREMVEEEEEKRAKQEAENESQTEE